MNKRGWRFDKLHLTRESAIVPPIRHQRRHRITPAFVIDFNDEKIPSLPNQPRYLEIERSETTFMLPDLLTVQINIRNVIRRTEVHEKPRVRLALIIKRLLVPNRPFVKEQLVRLRVPIARDLQRA